MTHWAWDQAKSRANKRKHGLSFETAQCVFDDPLHLSRPDASADEERWQTIGLIEGIAVVVVHTWREEEESGSAGRIISARKATRHEKKAYEDGGF